MTVQTIYTPPIYVGETGKRSTFYFTTNHQNKLIECSKRKKLFSIQKKFLFDGDSNNKCKTFYDKSDNVKIDSMTKLVKVSDPLDFGNGGDIYKFLRSINESARLTNKKYAVRVKFTVDAVE